MQAVLGFPDLQFYLENPCYLGSTLGRYSNRIAKALFCLDGRKYPLSQTPGAGGHCLHGGQSGFSHRRWRAEPNGDNTAVDFTLLSRHLDQGFPGNLNVRVAYSLKGDFGLRIAFQAECDAPTVISLANHAYFNLNNDGSTAENHELSINADRYAPLDETLIPTGELRDVGDSPFDFRKPAGLADRLAREDRQIRISGGFDHTFLLNGRRAEPRPAAVLRSPQSGLQLSVYTSQPGLHLYTGQFLGPPFTAMEGICLEAQSLPNAPNTKGFPSAVLKPGMRYEQETIYEFSMPAT